MINMLQQVVAEHTHVGRQTGSPLHMPKAVQRTSTEKMPASHAAFTLRVESSQNTDVDASAPAAFSAISNACETGQPQMILAADRFRSAQAVQGARPCQDTSFSSPHHSSCSAGLHRTAVERTSLFGLQTTGLLSTTCPVCRPVSMSDSKQMIP